MGPGQNGADRVDGGPQWERASWPPESRGEISIPCKIPSAGTTRKPFFFQKVSATDQTKYRVPDACSSSEARRCAQSFIRRRDGTIRFGFENESHGSCVTRLEFTSLRPIKRTRQLVLSLPMCCNVKLVN
jgi:hypothetical protein